MVSKLDGKYDDPEDIKRAREAAKKKGNKTFTVDGLRYDTATGRRKPLSAAPLLEATQRRIDYERTLYGDPKKKRLAKEKREKERIKQNRARAKANPSLLKGGVNYKKGGKVRGAGIARKGVRPAKMR